jgi:hypothetical protein
MIKMIKNRSIKRKKFELFFLNQMWILFEEKLHSFLKSTHNHMKMKKMLRN